MAWTLVEGNLCQSRVLILTLIFDAEHDENIIFYPQTLLFAIFSGFHRKFKNSNFVIFSVLSHKLENIMKSKSLPNKWIFSSTQRQLLLQVTKWKKRKMKNIEKINLNFFKTWYSCGGVCWKMCYLPPRGVLKVFVVADFEGSL